MHLYKHSERDTIVRSCVRFRRLGIHVQVAWMWVIRFLLLLKYLCTHRYAWSLLTVCLWLTRKSWSLVAGSHLNLFLLNLKNCCPHLKHEHGSRYRHSGKNQAVLLNCRLACGCVIILYGSNDDALPIPMSFFFSSVTSQPQTYTHTRKHWLSAAM